MAAAATVLSGLSGLASFDAAGDVTSLAQRWKTWKARFEIFVVASGIQNNTQKRALLLHMAGEGVQEIFKTFSAEQRGGQDDFNKAVECLDGYYSVRKNVPKERQNFMACQPNQGETINNFATRLKGFADSCEYGAELDNQVRDKVLSAIKDRTLRRKILSERDLTLTKLLEIVGACDDADAVVLGSGTVITKPKQRRVLTKEFVNSKVNVGDVTVLVILEKTVCHRKTTNVKSVALLDTFKYVVTQSRNATPMPEVDAVLRQVTPMVAEKVVEEEEVVVPRSGFVAYDKTMMIKSRRRTVTMSSELERLMRKIPFRLG